MLDIINTPGTHIQNELRSPENESGISNHMPN